MQFIKDWLDKRRWNQSREKFLENRKFETYRRGVREHLPNLSQRVFALRNTGYPGCGFHYSLEHLLGRVILETNNYNSRLFYETDPKDRMANRMIYQILVEELFERIMEIENAS